MNISYNWLKQYINVDLPAEELGKVLTSIGLELGSVEEVQTIRGGLEGIVIGEVVECHIHENADHLHVTKVSLGSGDPLQIVCGAPNVASGQKVMVATIGTTLYNGDESFTIKRSKIRGVESMGMICAEDEIGIGDSHEGIIVLPSTAQPGTKASDYYNIKSDYLIEVDITPNRVDAASHFGVARDLAAYFSLVNPAIQLTKPSVEEFKVHNNNLHIPVSVENAEACPRYSALTISGVTVNESPDWLKNALTTIGLRPINNVVDCTNYVLHEMGQPLHAFDADLINGKKVRVRNMPEGTPFTTLDEVNRKLSAADLMICDADHPMCIGGVFGGMTSGVTATTKNVFLESAYFNPVSIRKTARRHGLNTDASFRFERGCDPSNTLYILKRCALLIQQVAGGEITSEIVDVYPTEIKPKEVTINTQKIYSLIGKNIGKQTIETIFKALEMEIIAQTEEAYTLRIPLYRVDVERDVDVIEDILRIYGYNNIETSDKLLSTLSYAERPDSHKLQQLISGQLTAQGFNEILNNSLTKAAYYEGLIHYPARQCVKIINALSNDLNVMRQTLLFGGLESISHNINRKHPNLKLYEFGNCYQFHSEKKTEENPLGAYKEDYRLGIWLTGQKQSQSWATPEQNTSVYELKAYVENILRRMGIATGNLLFPESGNDLFSQAMNITTRSGKLLASYGVVHPTLARKSDISQVVFFAELHWSTILRELRKHTVRYAELPRYPSVRRDLALLLDQSVSFAELEKIAFTTEKKLLKTMTLFDVYEGKNIEAGKKSYAISFILQDENKTLTDKQIDAIMQKLQANFESQAGAKLR
jgi:phenylalanyl-tRNA synthetase beta chain